LKAISWAAGVELNYTKKRQRFYYVYKRFFLNFSRFYVFDVFLFLFERFYTYGCPRAHQASWRKTTSTKYFTTHEHKNQYAKVCWMSQK